MYYKERFTGKRQKVQTYDKVYYVPLLATLKQLLQNPDILHEVENLHHQLDKSILWDFCDGSVYKTHPLFSTEPNTLQIIGYYDELEIVNPLGSYVHKHKLGCLFFMLGNIRPRYRSGFKSIFLLSVSKCTNIAKYGLDSLLSPFVDDLKELYLDGINVHINGEQ